MADPYPPPSAFRSECPGPCACLRVSEPGGRRGSTPQRVAQASGSNRQGTRLGQGKSGPAIAPPRTPTLPAAGPPPDSACPGGSFGPARCVFLRPRLAVAKGGRPPPRLSALPAWLWAPELLAPGLGQPRPHPHAPDQEGGRQQAEEDGSQGSRRPQASWSPRWARAGGHGDRGGWNWSWLAPSGMEGSGRGDSARLPFSEHPLRWLGA